jgi:hypothetical protein
MPLGAQVRSAFRRTVEADQHRGAANAPCWSINTRIAAGQMTNETIKVLLMMGLIGAIEAAIHASQLKSVVHSRRRIFLLPWRQMRLALHNAWTGRRSSKK